MPKFLVWDTSSKSGALALFEADQATLRLVGDFTLDVTATHSERLLWAVDRLLESAGWTVQDIDCFGVGVGPGSFTGLRIGVTTARTLAHSLGKPVIPISSLAALARPTAAAFSKAKPDPVVVVATDASQGEYFVLMGKASRLAVCSSVDSKSWPKGVQEEVLTPEVLLKKLKAASISGWVTVGEVWSRMEKELPRGKRRVSPVPFADRIQGRILAVLAWEAWKAGAAKDALDVHPRYLRASSAEQKLKAGLLPKAPDL
jgi:tRNA threonylcarbamoyladenosine biosynthesis protein TsaB